jgi:hypothetical protein
LNYGGANPGVSNLRLTVVDRDKPEYALPGSRCKRLLSAAIALENVRRTYVFHGATKVIH